MEKAESPATLVVSRLDPALFRLREPSEIFGGKVDRADQIRSDKTAPRRSHSGFHAHARAGVGRIWQRVPDEQGLDRGDRTAADLVPLPLSLSGATSSLGLYYKLHNAHRPVNMKKPTIKRRKRVPAAPPAQVRTVLPPTPGGCYPPALGQIRTRRTHNGKS